MDLIVTERGKTHAAYLSGEDWTDWGSFETTLDQFCSWILQVQAGETREKVPIVRTEGDAIVIDLPNYIGIVTQQYTIDCDADDREQLLAELNRTCDAVAKRVRTNARLKACN